MNNTKQNKDKTDNVTDKQAILLCHFHYHHIYLILIYLYLFI